MTLGEVTVVNNDDRNEAVTLKIKEKNADLVVAKHSSKPETSVAMSTLQMDTTHADERMTLATPTADHEQGITRVKKTEPRLEPDIRPAAHRNRGPPELKCSGEEGHEGLQGTRCQVHG